MKVSAIFMMILTFAIIWGGFLFFIKKLQKKEKSKSSKN